VIRAYVLAEGVMVKLGTFHVFLDAPRDCNCPKPHPTNMTQLCNAVARNARRARRQNIWNNPVRDSRRQTGPTVMERREHTSLMAVVNGEGWYAGALLEFQRYPDRRTASAALVQRSRALIKEAQMRITATRNILAFSRRGELVN
jgi:hypothetical protein